MLQPDDPGLTGVLPEKFGTLLTNSFGLSDSAYPLAMAWTPAVAPVPLPAAFPLLLGGLAGLLLAGGGSLPSQTSGVVR
jgi:hypothetical protein